MEEIWKEIKGYEGYYQVSTFGRVRTMDRIIIQSFGGQNKKCLYKSKILKLFKEKIGYISTAISLNGKVKSFRVHRLVAETFIPNPQNKKTVNHINAIKSDNRVENLEWATYKENNDHSIANNLRTPPKRIGRNYGTKISQFTLDGIWVKDWKSAESIRRELAFSGSSILKCVHGVYKTSNGFIWKRQ
jgi:hypothetical protein